MSVCVAVPAAARVGHCRCTHATVEDEIIYRCDSLPIVRVRPQGQPHLLVDGRNVHVDPLTWPVIIIVPGMANILAVKNLVIKGLDYADVEGHAASEPVS